MCREMEDLAVRTENPRYATLALIGQGGDSWPQLLAAADCALYCAKRGGRNRIVLAEPSMYS